MKRDITVLPCMAIILILIFYVPSINGQDASMFDVSTAQVQVKVKESIGDVRNMIQTRIIKFDEFFRELLKSSKKDFHSMFLQTYGLLYERNSYIFTEMFQELEKYYVAGGVDLNQVLDFFFHRLYSKMFQVLNAQYTFDATYLKCVSEKMEELKPFGDIPKKLKIEVKRSFVATRTFVQSIMSGVEILDKVATITVSNDCSRAIDSYKMLLQRSVQPQSSSFHSSSFDTNVRNGNQRVPLCNEICSGLLTRCLSLHNELGHEWANYVDSLILLSSRLETSFNIESVVDPIDIKISEAIMNFQENGMQVSQKLFEECGRPKMGRSRRSPVGSSMIPSSRFDSRIPVDDSRYTRNNNNNGGHHSSSATASFSPSTIHSPGSTGGNGGKIGGPGESIERLLTDIKRRVKKTKDFWVRGLSSNVCTKLSDNDLSSSSSSSSMDSSASSLSPSSLHSSAFGGGEEQHQQTNCWNGSAIIFEERKSNLITGNGNSNERMATAVISGPLTTSGGGRRSAPSASPFSASYHAHNSNPDQVSMMRQQISRLKLITSKLNYAFNGLDVDWNADSNHDGDRNSETPDEDDDDDDLEPEGSGDGRDGHEGDDEDLHVGSGDHDIDNHHNNNNNGGYDPYGNRLPDSGHTLDSHNNFNGHGRRPDYNVPSSTEEPDNGINPIGPEKSNVVVLYTNSSPPSKLICSSASSLINLLLIVSLMIKLSSRLT